LGGAEGLTRNAGAGVPEVGQDLVREDPHPEAGTEPELPAVLREEECGMLGEVKHALAAAATIYFNEPTAAAPPGAVAAAPGAGTLLLVDVAVRLGVGAGHLSDLLAAYPELFSAELAGGGSITESGFLKAAALFRMVRDGVSRREILRRMALVTGETEAAATRDQGQEGWAAHLGRLVSDLQRSESRRVEDRDRFVTALMRTRQEIQHLRYELAAAIPRRQRRRGSFLSWLKN